MSVNYVEYLQGNNESYINTGVAIGIGYQIDVTFMLTRKPSTISDDAIYGVSSPIFYNYDNSVGTSVCYSTSRNAIRIRDGNEGGYNTREYIEINENNCLNNKYTLSRKIKEATNTYHVYLFANNHIDTILDAIADDSLRIYDFKIYNDSNTLLIHLKPCLDTEGVPCMYDEVSKQYFYNQGTGTFGYEGYHLYLFADNNEGTAENLGSYRLYNMKIDGDSEGVESGVDYVDYLESDGASWIDTGIMTNENTQIEVTCQLVARENYRSWFGSDKVSAGWQVTDNNGLFRLQGNGVGVNAGLSTNLYGKKVWKMDTSKVVIGEKIHLVTIDGVDKAEMTITKNENSTKTLKLFASHLEGDVIHPDVRYSIKGKIYDFKVYMDGQLKNHLKPCLDTEGVPCMYDEVSKQYFYNQGSGTFGYKKTIRDFQPVLDSNGIPTLMDKVNKKYYYDKNGKGFGYEEGYTPVSYLRSDGNSWINTGIIPTTNTKVVVDTYMLLTDLNNGPALFGSTETFLYFSFQTTQSWLYVGKINGKHSVGLAGHDFSGRHTITIDLSDMTNIVNIDGTNYGTFTGTQATDTNPIYLWNRFDKWGDLYNSGGMAKIYSFKIYENNVLTMDLIPILDNNNTPCMYDKISKQFFYNAGSGEFSYGIEESECPKANYVEYIRGGKNAYINTLDISGMINSEVEVEWKFKLEAINKATGWFGTVANYNGTPLYARNTFDSTLGNAIHVVFLEPSNNILIKTEDRHVGVHVMKINKTGLYMDGNLEAELPGTTYYDSYGFVQPFALLGYNYWNGIQSRQWENVLYYVTIKQAGELILDFRPCLDEDGVLCVYEAVNGVYYYNSDTGEFGGHGESLGYTPIKYIESNGTQYIDTNVVPTDNTDIDMVARACESKTIALDYYYFGDGHYYTPKFSCNEVNNAITNNSDHSIVADFYGDNGAWKWQGEIKSGATQDLSQHSYVAVRFTAKDQINYVNDYIFIQGEQSYSSKPGDTDLVISLQDCMSIGYLMNDLIIGGTYKFKETNTNVEPNLTASAGATLTLGSTYISYLSEEELEQATNNGWTIQ